MVASPILGGFGVGRSINAVDAQCINLFLEIIDTKDGAAPGYLQMAPGLDLLVTLGPGPIRGPKIHSLNGIAYVVSGPQLWALFPNLSSVLLGMLGTSAGNVSVIDNGSQVAIFDGYAGYLTSTSTVNSGGGVPLTGGTIGAGSAGFAVGDAINLGAVMGTQDATAVLTVTAETAGVVTSFTVTAPGLFSVAPTSFQQVSTSGNGSNFTLTAPTFGTATYLSSIALPFSGGPISATYQDGFGLVNDAGTNQFYQSDLDDLSQWEPLNFSSADAKPDAVLAMHDLFREVWLFKTNNIEIWVNVGQPGFTFQRLQGAFVEAGTCAIFSVAKAGDFFLWLSRTTQGSGIVMMAGGSGSGLRRMSTHAIEYQIAQYPTIADAIAFAYQQEGHVFYVLTFPTGDATWVLDLTTTEKIGYPVWHQRAAFGNGVFSRWWANALMDPSWGVGPQGQG